MLQKDTIGSAFLVGPRGLVPFLCEGREGSHLADPEAFGTYWVKIFQVTKGAVWSIQPSLYRPVLLVLGLPGCTNGDQEAVKEAGRWELDLLSKSSIFALWILLWSFFSFPLVGGGEGHTPRPQYVVLYLICKGQEY